MRAWTQFAFKAAKSISGAALVMIALASCSGESDPSAETTAAAADENQSPSAAPAEDAFDDTLAGAPEDEFEDEFAFVVDGPQIYADFCAGCHGADGAGIETVNPPLVGSTLLAGDPGPLAHFMLTLEYPQPPPASAGVEWTGGMGATAYLTDEELAAVLTYARESFTDADEVTAEQVAAVR